MKKILIIMLFLVPFPAMADHAAAVAAPAALGIVKKWDGRDKGKDLVSKSTFTLINKRGQERVRKTRRYWIDMEGKNGLDEKSIIFFDEPSDVKGTSLLNWSYEDAEKDDDQWLYLPALRKIKRIASSDKEKSFMGSDLTFDDMGDRNIMEDEYKLLGEENFNGHGCFVVEMTPKDKKYMYSRKVKWIDAAQFIDYKTEFYDRKGRFLKRQLIEWKQIDNVWVITRMSVKNDQTGHSTVIEIGDISLNGGVKESQFTKRKMESGR
ncbi:MAG: outer membrane lipoprotein-sorting protein [bacterium]|nr:outer membrane lipoprotein-sorting protein [bacterium]